MLKIYSELDVFKLDKENSYAVICHYCSHCNTEHIGVWEQVFENDGKMFKIKLDRKRFKDYGEFYISLAECMLNNDEISNFITMKTCPSCGEDFENEDADCHLYLTDGPMDEFNIIRQVADTYVFNDRSYALFRKDEYPNTKIKKGNIIQIDGFDVKISDTCPIGFMSEFWVEDDDPEDYFLVDYYEPGNFDSMLRYFRYRIRSCEMDLNQEEGKIEISQAAKQRISSIIENSNTLSTEVLSEQNVSKIKSSVEGIKKYLSTLYLLETDKIIYSKRLEELYCFEEEAAKDAKGSVLHLLEPYKSKINKLQEEKRKVETTEIVKETIKKNSFSFQHPIKPEKPKKPRYPEFEKPGLFNRKRILAENAAKEENYNMEMHVYKEKMSIYDNEIKKYHEKIHELEQQTQNSYNEACKKAQEDFENAEKEKQEKIKALEKELQKLQMEYDELPKNPEKYTTPEKEYHEIIKKEICTAEEQLKETCKLLDQLYQYNIIFEKYRDIVAISSFYEYLMSGRCNSLEGMGGAYNIYEGEIRANIIITQLSKIEESLEKIKENQYMVYTAFSKTNKSLTELNCKMASVSNSLLETNKILTKQDNKLKKLDEIANNTAITSYNTAMTAFYAKKNAELTNSLGFLLAM